MENLKAKRRNKEENPGRVFNCGCGRNYLSYAALYTHIKHKHEGTAPEGTFHCKGTRNRTRGRPRKSVFGDITHSSLLPHESADRLLEDYGLSGITKDPESLFENKEHPISRKFLEWRALGGREKQLKVVHTCDDIFALYLIDLAHHIRPEKFSEFLEYLHCLRDCINCKGWELGGSSLRPPGKEYCSCRSAWEVPRVCNYFILTELPKRGNMNREAGIVFALQFCTWLFSRAYTTLKLNLIVY